LFTWKPSGKRTGATTIDARGMCVNFSPGLRHAFAGLAAAVHDSEHFDSDMLLTVQEWAGGQSPTVHGMLISLPTIAGEAIRHIAATRDEKAQR
jgi:hypothetical protein